MKSLFLFFLLNVVVALKIEVSAQLKVACIGASITYGAGIKEREQNCYPAQLQRMLGNNYTVTNYGVSGCTLLKKGDKPYWLTQQYRDALTALPDLVVIDLGGNDSKLVNRVYLNEYESDFHDFIRSFATLASHPRIILLLAMPSFVKDTTGIWEPIITKQINPRIRQVAYEEKVELIDMHSPFVNREKNMPDKIHPDAEGAGIMSRNVYEVIAQPRDEIFNVFDGIPVPKTKSSFYGYECADFTFNGRACKIVQPKIAAKGRPWIWRARFWGHEPQTDIALLQNGFHVVYCDVAELLGNKEAIGIWDGYYQLLQKAGLAKKAVLEGMSRGAVYAFNWAIVNPFKVAAVYIDNPLLNISSWAAKVMKDTVKNAMLEAFKKDYNLTTEEDILLFKGSPVDKVEQVVKGKYPILALCADADEEVDPATNILSFEEKIKKQGGNITVIHKPGFKHHPHSLPDPRPIVDFLLKATGYYLPY